MDIENNLLIFLDPSKEPSVAERGSSEMPFHSIKQAFERAKDFEMITHDWILAIRLAGKWEYIK